MCNMNIYYTAIDFKKTCYFLQKTTAHRRYKDDVQNNIKLERMKKMYNVFRRNAEILNRQFVDTEQLILVEGVS